MRKAAMTTIYSPIALGVLAILIPLIYFVVVNIQGPIPNQPLTPDQSRILENIMSGGYHDVLVISEIVGGAAIILALIFTFPIYSAEIKKHIRPKKRPAIAVALVIFIIAFIVAGFIMIIFDQMFQATTTQANNLYPSGVYDPNVMLFFQDVWAGMAIVALIVLSVWLYLRSQESAVGID